MHTKQADTFCIHFLVAEKALSSRNQKLYGKLKNHPPSPKSNEVPLFFVQIIMSIYSIHSGKTSGVSSIPKKFYHVL